MYTSIQYSNTVILWNLIDHVLVLIVRNIYSYSYSYSKHGASKGRGLELKQRATIPNKRVILILNIHKHHICDNILKFMYHVACKKKKILPNLKRMCMHIYKDYYMYLSDILEKFPD
jgi:hypothetical protein